MIFGIKNLGPIKEANIEMGDLTIICGKNNCGKTYISYSIYDFYKFFRDYISFEKIKVKPDETETVRIKLDDYVDSAKTALKKAVEQFSLEHLNNKDAFSVEDVSFDTNSPVSANWKMRGVSFSVHKDKRVISIQKKAKADLSNNKTKEPSALDFANAFIATYFFGGRMQQKSFGSCFAITTERTGLSIFRKTLNKGNLRQVNSFDGVPILQKEQSLINTVYPPAIQDNFEYIISLEDISKHKSEIADDKTIIALLESITMGRFEFLPNDVINFVPTGNSSVKLTMNKASSSVRSLLLIDAYIRYSAKIGDLLMIDEPELNLHPESQRLLARLLAKLVNVGIKVFITTHSDYIIREFNTLISLNQDKPYLTKIKKREGYSEDELLDASSIRTYIARFDEDSVLFDLTSVSQEDGILVPTLDVVIDKMNQIQDAIIWGAD